MKKVILIIFLLPGFISAVAQQNFLSFTNVREVISQKEVAREISDNGLQSVVFEYRIPGAYLFEQKEGEEIFQKLFIEGFTHLKEIGKPAIPALHHIVAVPHGAKMNIRIIASESIEYDQYLIYPALQPATDRYGDPEPPFIIDRDFYNQNTLYPSNICELVETNMIRGTSLAFVQLCPVQYNPFLRKIKVYSYIKFAVEFDGGSYFLDKSSSSEFARKMANLVINNNDIKKESLQMISDQPTFRSESGVSRNYIIITTPKYQQAADSLAQWKMQLGYSVEIISKSTWTSEQVRQELKTRYESWIPKPDYFVIIGDNEDVPGMNLYAPTNAKFASDHYYACFDGANDYVADMASGRISVSTLTEALNVIKKIVKYERNPISDSAFYLSGLNCAQFQDDDNNGYADRRFSLTSEDVKNYIEQNTDIEVTRVYATETEKNPRFWNNGSFAKGEPLDSSLLKPAFPWNGSKTNIASSINKGVLYALHRDHGYAGGTGWHMPQFTTSDVNSLLSNEEKLPVLFSINCHTGEYQLANCFAETFLRKSNGGAVGVFAAAYFSYSGYNDALSLGLFDAIWANPGLVPNFTGTGGIKNPSLTPHDAIYTMGDVLNQGLIRMVETWGTDRYTFELFHYFGDPAMKIWTIKPLEITSAEIPDSIICNSTSITITNCSLSDATATLVCEGELLSSITLVNGSGTMDFEPIKGDNAIITISKTNYRPYIVNIPVTGGCPRARFFTQANNYCVDNEITFSNSSKGVIQNYTWDFGENAYPQTASTIGPHKVVYATSGIKNITLQVSGSAGSSTITSQLYIDENCQFFSPTSTNLNITHCFGILYDNGGSSFYSNQTDGVVSITPAGADNVTLQFTLFDFENGYDSLMIYDGPNTSSPLIGSFSGSDLPNGGTITSSGPAITLRQRTDQGLQKQGYELYFYCNKNAMVPVANLKVMNTESCSGLMSFRDMSRNYPTAWEWDFGDGNTSTLQNPDHHYVANGQYDVRLIVSNAYGKDTFEKRDYVSIAYPAHPYTIDGSICNSGSVNLFANCPGTVEWYDSLTGGSLLYKGTRFTTPNLTQDRTYYVQSNASLHRAGPTDNSIGYGGFYNYATEQGLIFSCFKTVILKSVLVSASGTKDRKIELKDKDGFTLHDTTINITGGTKRITLNFELPVGMDLKLVTSDMCNLYRNAAGAAYPYEIPGVLSITGNTSASAYYYYYFYDWEIVDPEVCKSERVPVTAYVHTANPSASFTVKDSGLYYTFSNTSSNFAQFIWYFGDDNFDTMSKWVAHHKYDKAGKYVVELNLFNGCGITKTVNQVNVVNAISENGRVSDILVFPNPNKGSFFIKASDEEIQSIRITSINGKEIYQKDCSGREGAIHEIKLENGVSEGLYLLFLQTAKGRRIFKVIVE